MRIADCFIEVCAYARMFLRQPVTGYDEFRGRIEKLLEQAKSSSNDAGHSVVDYNSALFAVVAWLDEAVMTSEWPEAMRWKKNLLQKAYFNTARAGVEFFNRLDGLMPHDKEVREVYYTCLCLGFKGQYVYEKDVQVLERLKRINLQMLLGDDADLDIKDETRLFPKAYPTMDRSAIDSRRRFKVSVAALAVFVSPLLVIGALYLIYHLILNNMVSGFIQLLK